MATAQRAAVTHRGHHFFVKGEGDVGTAVLVVGVRVALGPHRLLVGGPALAHGGAGPGEAAIVPQRDTGVAGGALARALAVQHTGPGATPNLGRSNTVRIHWPGHRGAVSQTAAQLYLRAGDFSVQTLTGIAVVIPLGPIWNDSSAGNARPSCN